MAVNNPFLWPYFLRGGGIGGGVPLDSHDIMFLGFASTQMSTISPKEL